MGVMNVDKVKVQITNRQKEVKIPSGIRLLIRRCCNAVLRTEGFSGSAEVSVSFLNNAQIGENGVYDKNMETGASVLGDIVISVEKAVSQAELYGHTLQREIGFLTVHSMLHLLGYDHESGGLAAALMREKEEEVLASLGLTRDISYVIPHS